MTSKQVTIEVAEFLESPGARQMVGVPREVARQIAEEFVGACYDGLGKAPRWIDAEDVRAIVVERLPGHFGRKDARVEHAPVVLNALVEHIAATTVMSQAFEVRRALPAACEELIAIVSAGRNLPDAPAKQDPFVHGASKLGRNDPCSCGSGKKYKKCHGKDA